MSASWLIHFFRRHEQDDPARSVPALDFLEGLPIAVAAEIHAVLDAVAQAPPPAFSGGGKWQAMHGDMAGFYEVRVPTSIENHRLFCLLERNADDIGGPSLICISGSTKPVRAPARPRDYAQARKLRDEFRRRRTVLS